MWSKNSLPVQVNHKSRGGRLFSQDSDICSMPVWKNVSDCINCHDQMLPEEELCINCHNQMLLKEELCVVTTRCCLKKSCVLIVTTRCCLKRSCTCRPWTSASSTTATLDVDQQWASMSWSHWRNSGANPCWKWLNHRFQLKVSVWVERKCWQPIICHQYLSVWHVS